MDHKIKNILGWAGIISIIIIALSIALYAYSYATSVAPSNPRTFSVSGEGKVIAIPNIAEFRVEVVTEGGMNLRELQSQNTSKINDIISYLKESGISEEDIQTINYNIAPRYEQCFGNRICPPARIIGYTINTSLSVRTKDFAKAGEILSGVVKMGANRVSDLTFKVDDKDAYLREARAKAIENAREKAKEIASDAGFRVGRIIFISESDFNPWYVMDRKTTGLQSSFVGESVSIEPGSQEIIVRVNLTYGIR